MFQIESSLLLLLLVEFTQKRTNTFATDFIYIYIYIFPGKSSCLFEHFHPISNQFFHFFFLNRKSIDLLPYKNKRGGNRSVRKRIRLATF